MRAAVVLLLLALPAAADHVVQELRCPAGIQYRVVRDLDGDGKDELTIVTRTGLWIWKGGARIKAEPTSKRDLPKGTALFHVGHLDGATQTFLFRTAEKYFGADFGLSGPGLPKRVANLLWRNLFTDLDGDGKADLVDVSLNGYRILFSDATKVLLPPELNEIADTDVDAASERLIARFSFAEWIAGHFNADRQMDFAVMRERGLLVYTGGKDKFDPKRTLEIDLPEAEGAELTLRDFNGDGRTDVLAVKRKEGIATLLVADAEKGLLAPRRVRLVVPGQMRYTIVSDLDGDGRPDLALPFVPKLSFQDIVRVVARREVVIRVPLFLNRGGDKVYPARADSKVNLPIRIRVSTDSVGRLKIGGLVIVEYGGDMDGDGRKDLVVTQSPTHLIVFKGVAGGEVYEKQHSRRIAIPDCTDFDFVESETADLNGDGLADIVLHYRGSGRRPDRLFVLWSRR